MQKELKALLVVVFLTACTQKYNDVATDKVETETQEEQTHKLERPFANGKILALNEDAKSIVSGIQGKLWARSSNLNSSEKEKEKSWVLEFDPINLKINFNSNGTYELSYRNITSNSVRNITFPLVRTTGNVWIAEKVDLGLNFRVTCLPFDTVSECIPTLSSVIEVISRNNNWSSGKAQMLGFLYGETSASVAFSGGLIAEFGNDSLAVLRSVSILNPVEPSTFLSLAVENNKGLLAFKAQHDKESASGMLWEMENKQSSSPLYEYQFLGSSDTFKEYGVSEVKQITFPIYSSRLEGRIEFTLKRPLISPNSK